jgi:hypothetical protein
MHKTPLRQFVQPSTQQPLEILSCCTRMQEQWELDFDGNLELRFEILELLFLWCKEEAVVVEAEFAKSNDMAGLFSRESEILDRAKKGLRAAWMRVEMLCRARMDAYSRVAKVS